MTRIRIGDVAAIPLDDDKVTYAHVLARHELLGYYYGVVDGAYARSETAPPVGQLVAGGYVLLGHGDADLIKRGDWPVVGRVEPNPSTFAFPRFKLWQGGPDSPVQVVTWDGEQRVAEPDEVPVLLPMTTQNGGVIENAARALHGLAPWIPEYDVLKAELVERSHGRAEPDGVDPRPIKPRHVDPEAPTELIALLLFKGAVERATAAQDQLEAGGWEVDLSREEEAGEGHLLEAKRSLRWKELDAAKDEAESLATRLGADDFGYEYALPRG